jgi:hypothetical protein
MKMAAEIKAHQAREGPKSTGSSSAPGPNLSGAKVEDKGGCC